MTTRVLMIGVGNDSRGDDAAGLEVVRRVAAFGLDGVDVVEAPRDAAALMEVWRNGGAGTIVVIDAMQADLPPGTIRCFQAGRDDLRALAFPVSSHAFGVAEAVGLAEALGRLPERLIVLGIEAAGFEIGSRLSPEEASAIEPAALFAVAQAQGLTPIDEASDGPTPAAE